jgi:hypothetical protein
VKLKSLKASAMDRLRPVAKEAEKGLVLMIIMSGGGGLKRGHTAEKLPVGGKTEEVKVTHHHPQ